MNPYELMPKKSNLPLTRVKKPEPPKNSTDWIIWAALADRDTIEEIKKVLARA